MDVAVVGGGMSGDLIRRAVEARGGRARMLSRSTGFDVLQDDLVERAQGVGAIIEAAGRFTTSRRIASRFFSASTHTVASAANRLEVPHVLLSIVNCDLPEVQGYGYFAAKAEQERLAREQSEWLILVRSTQWFEFADQNLDRMKFGPIALVPSMKMQPVALDAVADVLAACALGHRTGTIHNVAGPERMTLWDMTTQVPRKRPRPVPLSIPTPYGRAFRNGALVPGHQVEVVGPTFDAWLRTER